VIPLRLSAQAPLTQLGAASSGGYRLTIPRVPLSPNKLLGKHWSAKAKEKLTWMQELGIAGPYCWEPPAKCKMRVTITIYNARQYDRDNAWGACKPILDAMKALGLIVDDRASYCELEVRQEKSTRKDKRTVIEVEPCAS
jgi:hypothetical protein